MANAEKVAAVAELTARFRDSEGAVLTEYRGLTVAQLADLRRSLGQNATFAVVKNTLTKIAVSEAGFENQLSSLLVGPSAVAFVDGDVVEAAKGLRDFAKANPLLVIKGGVLDGKAISPSEIISLADLEPREVLLAKLAGAMKASLAGAAATFNALPVQMAQLAEALRTKRAAAEDAGPATASTDAVTDAASPDAASPDAASPDAASTAVTDAAVTDAASTDAASTDAASTEAASTDAVTTDVGSTDAASTDVTPDTPGSGDEG
jgi:large subunit ribosomal protein L10